jgi:DNA-binding NtrC family response regulator
MMRILVVDDKRAFREEACEYFTRKGWRAEGAGDGDQAIRLLSRGDREHDAVVLDRAIRRVDGDEVLRWMSEQPHLVNTCVVMLTEYPEVGSAVEAFKRGAFQYLEKSGDLPGLESILRAGIALKRAHKMRHELLKTLDRTRLLSRVVEVIREPMGSDLVHLIVIQQDGALHRIQRDGTSINESGRRFVDCIASGAIAVFEQKREQVTQLDPIFPTAGSLN